MRTMDPFRSEDPARVLGRLRAENASLRSELVTLEGLERTQWDGWARWGETPAAAQRTLTLTILLAAGLVFIVGSLLVGMMTTIVSCVAGPGVG
jgi:hypothetical protein